MQLNVTIDEELYTDLLALSKSRKTSLQEITRSALRTTCPEEQTIEVRSSIEGSPIKTRAAISDAHLGEGSYWFGAMEVDNKDMEKLGMAPDVRFYIKTENGRLGAAVMVGFCSGGWKGMLVRFVGVSSLS